MLKEIEAGGLKCVCSPHVASKKVSYMIYPAIVPVKNSWLEQMSGRYQTSVVMIYIPADGWNNMLTPWAEPGETPDSPPFDGKASDTLKLIQAEVIPEAEKTLGINEIEERNLIGVSLSGLFTFWQWMRCDTFTSIGCLSGSFWYPGFVEWFEHQAVPHKQGRAFFLLGVKEPKAWIKAYRSVGENTEFIVKALDSYGINASLQWVPGDHFADPEGRAEAAFKALF